MKPTDQKKIAELLLRNHSPQDNFIGLTPVEVHYLIYEPYSSNSPVRLRKEMDVNVLNQVPMFRIAEEYLKILQREKQIKLTPLGSLPKKVMVEVYENGFLPDYGIESGLRKLWKEQDCMSIMSARLTLETAGLVKKASNKLSLTKKGQLLLATEKRNELFSTFLNAFTQNFSWAYNDGYPEDAPIQRFWAFSVYLLNRFGDEQRMIGFYADKFRVAFPAILLFFDDGYSSKEEYFQDCYGVRTFYRFLLWFGFVSIEQEKKHRDSDTDKYKATEVLYNVFDID